MKKKKIKCGHKILLTEDRSTQAKCANPKCGKIFGANDDEEFLILLDNDLYEYCLIRKKGVTLKQIEEVQLEYARRWKQEVDEEAQGR